MKETACYHNNWRQYFKTSLNIPAVTVVTFMDAKSCVVVGETSSTLLLRFTIFFEMPLTLSVASVVSSLTS